MVGLDVSSTKRCDRDSSQSNNSKGTAVSSLYISKLTRWLLHISLRRQRPSSRCPYSLKRCCQLVEHYEQLTPSQTTILKGKRARHSAGTWCQLVAPNRLTEPESVDGECHEHGDFLHCSRYAWAE